MKRSAVIIAILAVLLVASNAWWAYAAKGSRASLENHRIALKQTLAILPVVASAPSARTKVVTIAAQTAGDTRTYEKSGFVWVGRIALKFEPDGRLIEAVPAWSSP